MPTTNSVGKGFPTAHSSRERPSQTQDLRQGSRATIRDTLVERVGITIQYENPTWILFQQYHLSGIGIIPRLDTIEIYGAGHRLSVGVGPIPVHRMASRLMVGIS